MTEAAGSSRPILLKKPAMVSRTERYAPEIEIFTLSRRPRAQALRNCAQKSDFGSQYVRSLEGLNRLRLRGMSGATDEFTLAAVVQTATAGQS